MLALLASAVSCEFGNGFVPTESRGSEYPTPSSVAACSQCRPKWLNREYCEYPSAAHLNRRTIVGPIVLMQMWHGARRAGPGADVAKVSLFSLGADVGKPAAILSCEWVNPEYS